MIAGAAGYQATVIGPMVDEAASSIQGVATLATDPEARKAADEFIRSPSAWGQAIARPWQQFSSGLSCGDYNLVGRGAIGLGNEVVAVAGIAEGGWRLWNGVRTKVPPSLPESAPVPDNAAHSAAQGAKLHRALSFEEPFSNFTSTGEINPEVIAQSQEIIPGSDLRNPAVISGLTADGSNIADWGKWESPTSKSPLGRFRIHFYRNRITGKVNYNFDYKVKLAIPGQPEMPVGPFLEELRELMNSMP